MRLDLEQASQSIHDGLVSEARARTRHAAIRLAGWLVGGHCNRPPAHGFYVVRPLDIAGRSAGFDPGRPWPGGISAGVAPHVAVDAEQLAEFIGIAGDAVPMVAAIGVADQMLVPILNPAHRESEFQRSPYDCDGLALEIGLESERTPYIRTYDADPPL